MYLLDKSIQGRLATIIAPAGHGKTTSVVSWLEHNEMTTAWVSVDPRDASLTRFATHLAVALGLYAPRLLETYLPHLTSPDRLDAQRLGAELGDSLYAIDHEVVLVVDDLHWAMTERNLSFLSGLIDAAPRRLRFFILSRQRVPLPMARLRVQDSLLELLGADLRFSSDETAEFLTMESHAPVVPELADRVHDACGGWPAAVRLMGLGMHAWPDLAQAAEPASVDVDVLLQYLSEEVLDHLPAHQREMLLFAALPARFTTGLLIHLCQDGQEQPTPDVLRQLRALDLYREEAGPDDGWLVYHPVFRAAFQTYLQQRVPQARLREAHTRIAAWFARNAMIREAVEHYVFVHNIDAAANVITAHAQAAFDREDWRAVDEWLQHLPAAAIDDRRELVLISAWVSYLSGRWGRLRRAVSVLRTMQQTASATPALSAELDAAAFRPSGLLETDPALAITQAQAIMAEMSRDKRYQLGFAAALMSDALAAAGDYQDALDWLTTFLEQESATVDAASIRGYIAKGLALWRMGAIDPCAQTAHDAVRLASAADFRLSAAWAELFMARIALERGELVRASLHYHRVIADSYHVHFDCLREAFVGQTLAFEFLGQHDEADRAVGRFRELAASAEYFEPLLYVDALAAQVALMRGDLTAARTWVRSTSPTLDLNGVGTILQPMLIRAHVLATLRGDDELAEAHHLVAAFLEQAARVHHRVAQIEGLAVQALVYEHAGQRANADAALRASLVAAAPERLVQRYVVIGPGLAPVLRRLVAGPTGVPYARDILRAVEQTWAKPATGMHEPAAPGTARLSPRELDVLHCLELRYSTAEIAGHLFISANTVQNHIAHIRAKLGLPGGSRRRAIVDAARAQGHLH